MAEYATAVAEPEVLVHANKVSRSLGGRPILSDVSTEVHRGEVVVLIGPSGAGKTTFLRTINHLEQIDSGDLFVNGHRVGYRKLDSGKLIEDSAKKLAKQREEIGFVFQHFNLFPHMTVLENIWHAPVRVRKMDKKTAVADARRLLARVGLVDKGAEAATLVGNSSADPDR